MYCRPTQNLCFNFAFLFFNSFIDLLFLSTAICRANISVYKHQGVQDE